MKFREVLLVLVVSAAFGLLSRYHVQQKLEATATPIARASVSTSPAIRVTKTPHQPAEAPAFISKSDIEDISLEGIRLNMSRQDVLQIWGACSRSCPSSEGVEEILYQKSPERDAYISPQGKVLAVMGSTLRFRAHVIKSGATLAELQEIFGLAGIIDEKGPFDLGTWSYFDGELQGRCYNTKQGHRLVGKFELRNSDYVAEAAQKGAESPRR